MKTLTSSLAVVVCLSLMFNMQAFATIWRVDNNTANISDFTTLQAAHDGAQANDTLYVYGSPIDYGDCTLTKTLYIFGTGYFLTENPETQANPLSAICSNITFNEGSEGSVLSGMVTDAIVIATNQVVVKRNKTLSIGVGNSNSSIPASNLIIQQNYIEGDIGFVNNSTNIIIHNNVLQASNALFSSILMAANTSADIRNNIIVGVATVYNSIFYNNISTSSSFNGTNTDVKNNIATTSIYGTSNGNQELVDISTVFELTGSPDGMYLLKDSSPASGAGFGGVDCGIFGGTEPYVLSGLPALPAIWFLDVPTSGSTSEGLPIHIKAKTHN
ncbi:MAG: hypothetical protein RIG77_13810 [Cyclobacteriaceae bacterium]